MATPIADIPITGTIKPLPAQYHPDTATMTVDVETVDANGEVVGIESYSVVLNDKVLSEESRTALVAALKEILALHQRIQNEAAVIGEVA